MRIGIMGGTFDPVHIAHLIIAEEARERLDLSRIVFIPAGDPWLKEEEPVTPAHIRLDMVYRATLDNPSFEVSDIEIQRPGPTYTVDTLAALREDWGQEAEVFFIMGMDALARLPEWKEPELFLEQCTPVVFVRPEYPRSGLCPVREALPGVEDNLKLLDGPAIGVSSTGVRCRVAEGRSIRYLVPPGVAEVIRERGLYKGRVD